MAYALERAGWAVYLPLFAAHTRIDLVACSGAAVVRVQVKTSKLRGGTLQFPTCSNTGNVRKTYENDVDAFGVWSEELGRAYLVPVAGLPRRLCSLRLRPPLSAQQKGIRYAAEYEVRRRC